ncbi:MAG: hypothetical protein ACREL3_02645 [Gemmatimonadales bacterium]
MRAHIPGRYAALALLLGGLACAGNKNNDNGTVVAKDSASARDTSAYQVPQRDTMAVPRSDTSMALPAPADTATYQPTKPSATPDTSGYAPAAPATPADTISGMTHDSSGNSNAQ